MRATRTGLTAFKTVWPVLFIGTVNESDDGPKLSSSSLRSPLRVYGVGVMGKPR